MGPSITGFPGDLRQAILPPMRGLGVPEVPNSKTLIISHLSHSPNPLASILR